MRPSLVFYLLAFGAALFVFEATATSELLTLRHNPFTRPEALKPKPPPPPAPPQALLEAPEEIELIVSATMVSKHAPMAIVDGELLAVGDRIRGLKLVAVREGKVVFYRDGRRYVFEIDNGRKLGDLQ